MLTTTDYSLNAIEQTFLPDLKVAFELRLDRRTCLEICREALNTSTVRFAQIGENKLVCLVKQRQAVAVELEIALLASAEYCTSITIRAVHMMSDCAIQLKEQIRALQVMILNGTARYYSSAGSQSLVLNTVQFVS